jgi:hypothetical protein
MGITQPNLGVFFNVSFIAIGVAIATFGEITFILTRFLFQCGGIVFEAIRLVLVQKLLNGEEYKMDPLVSLYYFAPVCAAMNGMITLFLEVPHISMQEVYGIGAPILIANTLVAFLLNVSAVFLVSILHYEYSYPRTNRLQIGRTSSLVLTLCGVVKDVLLVAASMMLWHNPVSNLQFFGYAISLAGLIYYKLGAERIKVGFTAAMSQWTIFTAKYPIVKTLIALFSVIVTLFILLGILMPKLAADYDPRTFLLSGAVSIGLAT